MKDSACSHQDDDAAGRRVVDKTVRPICALRLDLVAEQWAPVLFLVNLEPLNEP